MTSIDKKENEIRQMIEGWAAAVRSGDIDAVLAHHSDDVVMYDVPPPFQSVGIDAYRKTWDLFFANAKPGVFDIQELTVVAGDQVAFCYATMKCGDKSGGGDYVDLYFRLTVGLRKTNNRWTILHEHHSVPSE